MMGAPLRREPVGKRVSLRVASPGRVLRDAVDLIVIDRPVRNVGLDEVRVDMPPQLRRQRHEIGLADVTVVMNIAAGIPAAINSGDRGAKEDAEALHRFENVQMETARVARTPAESVTASALFNPPSGGGVAASTLTSSVLLGSSAGRDAVDVGERRGELPRATPPVVRRPRPARRR